MPDTLEGGPTGIGFNKQNTVGVLATEGLFTNETRRTRFKAKYLKEWAEYVCEAYGADESIEVIFTPEHPMIAVPADTEAKLGVSVAHRVKPDGDSDGE
jgi:hypothetical protein